MIGKLKNSDVFSESVIVSDKRLRDSSWFSLENFFKTVPLEKCSLCLKLYLLNDAQQGTDFKFI